MSFDQMSAPKTGETVAVIHTNKGDFSVRLFADKAPKTVENFTTHAKNGYYNGIIFHRVIENFMIQGGDPTGTGCGGESIWGGSFEDEFSKDLHNYRGALSMANAGPNTNGSQFFIVTADEVPENLMNQMKDYPQMFPTECVEQYARVGGTPWLDYHHTVFGQIMDGMEVVDAIGHAATDANDRPIEEISIVSIDIQ